MKNGLKVFWLAGLMVVLDILVWLAILGWSKPAEAEYDFLDVGQGDSELVRFAGGAKVLIDGGPANGGAEESLSRLLPMADRYLDLVIISHPQLDHFGGLIELLKHYRVGAILTSGLGADNVYWQELEKVIRERQIPQFIIAGGDRIKYQADTVAILSPAPNESEKDLNDMSLVELVSNRGVRGIFGADMTAKKEKELARRFNVKADILKVSHHGSKYSSDPDFLKAVSPAFAVIEVGQGNNYGHPTKEALGRLAGAGAKIYRTDKNGIIKLTLDSGRIKAYALR